MEDYLEAIGMLAGEQPVVKVSQLSRRLKVKMPSVSLALRRLGEQGLVEHERYGHVKLTPEGARVAAEVIWRHHALRRFLGEVLGVDQRTADEDACRIEHVISPVSVDRLAKFVGFMEACPLGDGGLSGRYQYYLQHGRLPKICLEREGLELEVAGEDDDSRAR